MKTAWISETGKRADNQDCCQIFSAEGKPLVVVVADGMGGHAGGATASMLAVTHIMESCNGQQDFDEAWLRKVLRESNALIHEKSLLEPKLSGMGTTVVVCVIHKDCIWAANVGDSRLYLVHDGTLEQITTDHSYVQELVALHVITKEEARLHPRRNIITRAVGTDETVEVDVFHHLWSAGDMVILSTDGLHDAMSDDKLFSLLRSEMPLKDKVRLICSHALENGSTDNVTALICLNDGQVIE